MVNKCFLTTVFIITFCFIAFALSPQCTLICVMELSKQLCRPPVSDPSVKLCLLDTVLKEPPSDMELRRYKERVYIYLIFFAQEGEELKIYNEVESP